MKTIIMAVTINYFLQLGLQAEANEYMQKGLVKETKSGIQYLVIEDNT